MEGRVKWVCDGGRGEGVGGEVDVKDEMSGRVEDV